MCGLLDCYLEQGTAGQMNIFILTASLLGVALAVNFDPNSYAPDRYLDLADLYRMQLLSNAFTEYEPQDENQGFDSRSEEPYWPNLDNMVEPAEDKDSIYNDRLYSGPHLRDQEHLEHSALHGYQSVSGGAAEIPPNPKEVKTDKHLPEYCNPPNPCPVGKTAAKDNCVEDFENSAENNERLLSQQECPCDTEHMFSCPIGSQTVSSKGQAADSQQMALNKVMDELAKMGTSGNNMESSQEPTEGAQKPYMIVAKKSPHIIHKRSEHPVEVNPYLQGSPLAIAAKKDPNMAKRSISHWKNDE